MSKFTALIKFLAFKYILIDDNIYTLVIFKNQTGSWLAFCLLDKSQSHG